MNQGSSSVPEERYPERSLRDFLYILFRHKWKVILFFLAVMVTVTLGTFLVAEIYRAEAKLMVRIGRENVSLDPTATTGQVISTRADAGKRDQLGTGDFEKPGAGPEGG